MIDRFSVVLLGIAILPLLAGYILRRRREASTKPYHFRHIPGTTAQESLAHGLVYHRGGTRSARRAADMALRFDMVTRGHLFRAMVVYGAVRGVGPVWPVVGTRWGQKYPFPQWYTKEPN